MLIADLEATHAEYNPIVLDNLRALDAYSDFYYGGKGFQKRKDSYLRRRPIESQPGAESYRQNRLASAYITPHAGGIGDNLCGTALQIPPTIDVKSGPEEKRAKYWRNLNSNLDGLGSDTRSVAWALLCSLVIHKRAYIVVNFPKDGGNDATFNCLTARDVDDWQKDEDGKYLWIRSHCVDLVRSGGEYGPQDTERHTWTFYTATDTQEFTADRKIGESWPKEATATAGAKVPHGLGVCPVFPVEVEDKFWVMDRLFSTAHAYFNREASRSFAIDTGAHVLPVLKSNKDTSNLVVASGFCIKIAPEDNFGWAGPDAGIYAALKDDCDYLLSNLYSALNQMALTAAGMAGNPRQSGTAKSADASAIKAFLSLLCSPIMRAFRNAFKAVQIYRGEEDLDIDVHGMSNFDVQSIELEINRCLTFVAIPGMPPTAKKESLRRAIRAYLPDISGEDKEDINEELDNPPEPVLGTSAGEGILNATTGRPQGFAPGQVSQQFLKHKVSQDDGKSLTKTG